MFRIHHQLLMNDESVSECLCLKVVQSRRSCTLILKMGRCNARTHFSHPPPTVYEWGECTRGYMFESSSVMREHIFRIRSLKMGRCNARTHFSYPPPAFYEWGECTRVYVYTSSSIQTVPHPNFENGTLQCDNTFVASTTSCLWMRRVYQSVCF